MSEGFLFGLAILFPVLFLFGGMLIVWSSGGLTEEVGAGRMPATGLSTLRNEPSGTMRASGGRPALHKGDWYAEPMDPCPASR